MQADSSLLYCSPDWRKTLESFHHIKDNNRKLAMEPYPGVKVLAAFAKLVYSDCLGEKPEGWYLLTTAQNTNNGYFGCAVWNPSQHQIIIAHRGTDIKNLGAIWTDIQSVYLNNFTGHMNSAVSFADEVKRVIIEINKGNGRYVLSFTGHSLGAWLAGVTTFTVKYLKMEGDGFHGVASPQEGLHAHTLALDSPGTEDILNKICRNYRIKYDQSKCSKHLDITNIFAAPNLVNCTGYQVGNLLQIHIERVALPSDFKEPTLMSNIDTHGVDIFLKAFDDGSDTHLVRYWPQGWSEREYHHRLEMFCNSYALHLDAIQASTESSSSNHRKLMKGNAGSEHSEETQTLQDNTIKSLEAICQLGVFSTEEFKFIQNWSFFQTNALMKRTEIEKFILRQKLKKIDIPLFEIDSRSNTITCDSRAHLEKVIGQTKQLLRWFPSEIKEAMDSQNRSIQSAPLYMAGLAYLDTLPNILDCEDTLGLKSFLESSKSVLQILVTSDFEFQAARLHNILFRMENTTLEIKYLDEKCHTILNWNCMPTLDKAIDFQGLSKTDVNISNLIILIANSAEITTSQLTPFLENLKKFSHKKLVVIKSQPIDDFFFEYYNLTVETKTSETFGLEDLTPWSRQQIFSRDAITIGEETLSLEVILGNDCKTPDEKINKLISPILKNLVTDNLFIEKIPNNLPRLCQLEALYSKGNKLVDRARLTALLERSGASGPPVVISDPEGLSQDYWLEVGEGVRKRILTTVEDGQNMFLKKCWERPARPIYWFHLSNEGFTLNEVFNRSVYLPRKFRSRLIIKSINEFVQYKGDKDLFIFNNVEDKASLIQTFGLSGEAEDVFKKNDHFIIRSPSQELSAEDKKKEDSFSKHYFEMLDIRSNPCLVWKYSKGSLDGLRPFITTDFRNTVEEKDFCAMKKKHTIIADDPGMGKTTILTRMSELIAESWVLRIDHKNLADLKLPSRLNMKSVIKFLIHSSSLPTDKIIVSNLLEYCLQSNHSKQVCVLVDAFDEVFEENKIKMAELLKYLKTATTCQIVVTTRVYQQTWLENDLEEFAVELEKITEEEQEEYLVNFWLPHLALELPKHEELEKARLLQFARELRTEMERVLRKDVTSFMGIPLQIRMLAEVFLEQAILSALNPEQVNNLRKITNSFDLYKQFVEVKKKIFFEQKTNINKLPSTYQKAIFKDTMEKHCVLAFQTIDPTFAMEYFTNIKLYDLTTEEMKDISSLGLIKYKTNGSFQFIHRTFQEYFCADFFVRWLRQGINSKEENILIKSEFYKFLLKPYYKIIRMFIETQLETTPIYEEELENHPKIYQHWSKHRQLFFNDYKETPLHIAAVEQKTRILGVLLSGPPSRTSDEGYISFITSRAKRGETVLNVALEFKNTDIVNQITKNIGNCSYESIVGLMLATFLDKEEDNDDDYFEEYLFYTQQLTTVNLALKRTRHIRDNIFEQFIAAVRDDDFETVLKIFGDLESDTERAHILIATDGWGHNAINLATSKRNHTLFKLFAKQGVCVSYDKYGQNPLHCAAEEGYFNIVNFLLNQSEETYEQIDNGLFGKEKTYKNRNVTLKNENNSSINSLEMLAHINSVSRDGETALMFAAYNGHHEVTRMLLEFGADTNSANSDGNTALMDAAQNGHSEVIRMLLDSGADTNSANSDGNTALMDAAQNGHHEVTRMLLESGAETNSIDSEGYTALMYAAQNGHHEVTRILLESRTDIYAADRKGNTALMLAAYKRHYEVMRILLESGTDANYSDSEGYTALMNAAWYGHHKVTRILLEYGAYTHIADRGGNTALMFAALNGHQEVTHILIESGADTNSADRGGNTVLMYAAQNGHHEVTRMLLVSGADTNSADSEGYTALMYAAQNGHHEVTRMLLESGADIYAVDRGGNTALMLAVQKGNHEMTRILLDSMADTTSTDREGYTALMYAALNGHHEVLRMLVEAGAFTYFADMVGNTALMLAAQKGHHEVTRILLESGTYTNSADSEGFTALMYAARGGHYEVTRMLLESGADTSSAENEGFTALIYAAQKGHHEVTRILLDFGADTNSSDSVGYTPLMRAAYNGHHEVARMLLESEAEINHQNRKGKTAMYEAAFNGHVNIVELLLQFNANISLPDQNGRTALSRAEERGHQEIVDLLRGH